MAVSFLQSYKIGKYILGKRMSGQKRYPLVLMLEPLFKCNLACAGCGKIDYPKEILDRRLSLQECLEAVDECGAPVVSIPGGEPLIHPEMPEIVKGIVARKKFVYLCSNAVLLERKLDDYEPSPYLTLSIHLDGLREEHDKSVCRDGVFDKAVSAIKAARARGFRVTINCTLFDDAAPERIADFFDYAMTLGIEGIMTSPGYQYEFAPRQDVFLGRQKSKQLFREVLKLKKQRKAKWEFNQSPLYADFLAGNQTYQCTPWGSPTRNIFGWQKPCYLMADAGYASSFGELMETTDWEAYGVGNHAKCDNCQMHCGFEPTAVNDSFKHPLKLLRVALRGPRLDGPFADEPSGPPGGTGTALSPSAGSAARDAVQPSQPAAT